MLSFMETISVLLTQVLNPSLTGSVVPYRICRPSILRK